MEEEKKEELNNLLKELKTKMKEINELTEEIKEKKKQENTPKKTEKILEEIEVPSLELLK